MKKSLLITIACASSVAIISGTVVAISLLKGNDEPTHVHSFGEWEITSPTCSEDGERKRYCSCGEIQAETLPGGHVKVIDGIQKPTCTEDGWEFYECEKCGYEFYTTLFATGHNYENDVCTICKERDESAIYEEYFVYTLNEGEQSYSVGFFTEESIMVLREEVNNMGVETEEEIVAAWRELAPVLQLTTPLTIPSTYNDLPITAICNYAFPFSSFERVTIPDSVTNIGDYAFSFCSNLTSVTFKNKEGWSTNSTSISATDLEDHAKAATYLRSTYTYSWSRN